MKLQQSRRGKVVFPLKRLLASVAVASGTAFAAADLPTGESIQHGSADIFRDTNTLTVDQHSGHLIVNWEDFSVGAGNTVIFDQKITDIALNRVVGDNPSYIFGDIRAGGQVFLVNQSGVLFSPTSRVDAAGLVASTLDIADEDFLAGNYNFEGNGGSVINQGQISVVDGGYVALLGQEAINEGIITARLGTVALGSGDRISVDMNGDGLVQLQVDKGTLDALVANRGVIIADGGLVYMTAQAASELAATVVNNDGIIEANSVEERDGRVFLTSNGDVENNGSISVAGANGDDAGQVRLQSTNGTTLHGGTIDASSQGGVGGSVQVLGEYVGLTGDSLIDASGTFGGGQVLVGGDFQGSNADVQNALRTYVGSGASIRADATLAGDGGKVIIWSDEITRYYGDISATGGDLGGDGGFAEVSGKQSLGFWGAVDLTAATGRTGQLLLDPQILSIVDAPAAGDLDPQLVVGGGTINFGDSGPTLDQVSVFQINTTGALADINLNAGQINFDNTLDIALGAGNSIAFTTDNVTAGGGDDSITNTGGNAFSITTTGAGTVSFTTTNGGAIDLSGITVNSDSGATLDGGAITLGDFSVASLGVTAAGDISQNAGQVLNVSGLSSFTSDTNAVAIDLSEANDFGSITLLEAGAGSFSSALVADANDISVSAADADSLTVRADGSITVSGDITTAGDIILNADRDADLAGAIAVLTGRAITSNGGDIVMGGGADPASEYAYGVGTGFYSRGINIESGASLASGGGNISLRGASAAIASGEAYGIKYWGAIDGGTGTVVLDGLSRGQGGANSQGIEFVGTVTSANTTANAISITGEVAAGGANTSAAMGVNFGATVTSTAGGGITVNGTGASSTNAAFSDGITVDGVGSIDAGTGDLTMTGVSQTGNGVEIVAGSVTGEGNITITGSTAATGTAVNKQAGVVFANAGTRLTTADGTVVVNGTSTGSDWSMGILVDAATVETTGTGSLTFNATQTQPVSSGPWGMNLTNGAIIRSTSVGGGALTVNAVSEDYNLLLQGGSQIISNGGLIAINSDGNGGANLASVYLDGASTVDAGSNGAIEVALDGRLHFNDAASTFSSAGGTLDIRQFTGLGTIGLVGAYLGTSDVELLTGIFGTNLSDGFAQISIGNENSGDITVAALGLADINDALRFETGTNLFYTGVVDIDEDLTAITGDSVVINQAVTTTGAIDFQASNSVQINAAVTATGNLSIAADADLTAEGGVVPDNIGPVIFGAAGSLSGDNVSVSAGSGSPGTELQLGDITAAGTLDISTTGDPVLQLVGTAISAGAATSVDVGAGGNVVLNNTTNDFTSVSVTGTAANAVHITDQNAVTVSGDAGSLNVRGTSVTLGGGNYGGINLEASVAVDQSNEVIVSGTTNITATAAGVDTTLTDVDNDFGTVRLLVSGLGTHDVASVVDTNALIIGGDATTLNATSGANLVLTGGSYTTLDATVGGNVTQNAAGDVSATSAIFRATAANLDVTLNEPLNDFASFSLDSTLGSFNAVSVYDANALSVNGDATTLTTVTVGGLEFGGGSYTDVTVTAGGNVTQGAVVDTTISGTAAFVADTNAITLTLDNAGNEFNEVTLSGVTGGTFTSATVTDADVGANGLTIGGNAGALTAATAGALDLSGGGYTTLDVTAGGDVSQSGALTVSGASTLTADTGAIAVDLSTATNDFNTLTFATANSGTYTEITVDDDTALSVGNAQVAGAGNVSLSADDNLTVTGTLSTATGDIILNADDDATGAGLFSLAATGTLSSANNLDISAADFDFLLGSSMTVAGDLSLIATQAGDMCLAAAAGACQVNLDAQDLSVLTAATSDLVLDNNVSAIITSQADLGGTNLDLLASTIDDLAGFIGLDNVAALTMTTSGIIGGSNDGLTLEADTVDVFNTGGSAVTLVSQTSDTVYDFGLFGDIGNVSVTEVDGLLQLLGIQNAITTNATVTLNAQTGAVDIVNGFDVGGAVSVTGAGGIDVGGDISTTNDNIAFNSATRLTNTVAIGTDTGIGDITFVSTLDGSTADTEALTLSAGTGAVDFQNAVGGTTPLASLDITAGAVTVQQAVDVGGLMEVTNGGLFTTLATGDIVADGGLTQNGAGVNSLAGDITTTDSAISFATDVTLAGPVVMTTGAGAGDIVFAALVDGTTANTETLDLTAGTGSINFQGAVGGTTDLGDVTINSAADVDLQAAFDTASFTQLDGTGTTTIDGALTTTVGDVDVTTNQIVQNAAIASAGEVLLESTETTLLGIDLNSGVISANRLIHMISASGVSQDAASHGGLQATDLLLEGSGDFTLLTTTNDNLVSNVATVGTVAGVVAFENDQTLAITAVDDAETVVTTHNGVVAETVLVSTSAGDLTVAQAVDATTGNLLLESQTGALAINNTVDAAGSASLLAGTGITQAALGDITVGGSLDVNAQGGDINMTDGAVSTATGNARYLASGSVWVASIDAANVRVEAGQAIIDNGDTNTDIIAGGVQLVTSVGSIAAPVGGGNGPLDIEAATLAASAAASGIFVDETVDSLAVGSVAAIDVLRVGIDNSTANQAGAALAGAAAAGDIIVRAATGLTVSSAVDASTGHLLLQAQNGDLAVNASVDAGTDATLLASANVTQAAAGDITAGDTLKVEATAGSITMTDGAVSTATGNISYVAGTDVTVGSLSGADVYVAAGDDIVDGGDTDVDIIATSAQLVAFSDIGEAAGINGGPLETTVTTLATQSGANTYLSESDALVIGAVAAIDVDEVLPTNAVVAELGSALNGGVAGNNYKVEAGGAITVDQAVSATEGDVLLDAQGGNLTLNNTVTATTAAAAGNVSLLASAAITQAAAGDVSADGTLDVNAQGGSITMTDGAQSTATGNVRYLATGDISVASISGANVRVESGGSIIDNGNTHTDVIGGGVQLVAATNIGEPAGTNNGLLDVEATTLSASAGTGDIFIDEVVDALTVGSVAAIDVLRVNINSTTSNQAGVVLAGVTAASDAVIRTTTGLTIDNAVDATGGNLLLQAQNGNLAVNAAVSAGQDATLLTTTSGNITQGANGDISAGETLYVNSVGNIVMSDGAVSTATGNIAYNGVNITLGSLSGADVFVAATGDIIDGGETDVDIIATNAQLVAVGEIGEPDTTNNGPIDTTVTTIATQSGGNTYLSETDGLVVGSVAAINVDGVQATALTNPVAGILLAGGSAGNNYKVEAGGAITVDQAVSATEGDILLDATGALTLNNTVTATTAAAAGNISLLATGTITQAAAGDVSADGTLDVDAGDDILMTDGAISVATGNVRYEAFDAITVASVQGANVRLDAGSSITDSGDTNIDVIGGTVQLVAGTGAIGEPDGTNNGLLDVEATTLSAAAGTDIFIDEVTDSLVVGSVAAIDVLRVNIDSTTATQSGVVLSGATAGSDLVIRATDGLTIDNAVDAVAGQLFLQAQNGDLAVNAAVDAANDATLLASANVTQSVTGDITVGGTLDVEAQGGDITMADSGADSAVSTATGNIRYLATGDIRVGSLSTGADVLVETTGGSIIDNGETAVDVIAANTQLVANGSIGEISGTNNGPLETTVTVLAAEATNGNVYLFESDNLEIGTVAAIDVARVAVDNTTATQAGTQRDGIQAQLEVDVESDGLLVTQEVRSVAGNILLTARNGAINQTGATALAPDLNQVIALAGNIEMDATNGNILLQRVSAAGNTVTLTTTDQILNNNLEALDAGLAGEVNVIADTLIASADDTIGLTAAGQFTDPTNEQRLITEVENDIQVFLAQAGTVGIDNTSTDGSVDVVFNLPLADVSNGSSVWVRTSEALRALGLEFATENNSVAFNGNLQLLALEGDLTLNEDQAPDANDVNLVAQWMRLSAARGAFRNGDGSRFLNVGDGLVLTADDLVIVTGGDLGVEAIVDRADITGTGLYQVAPGGTPGTGGENANLDIQLSKRDITVVDDPILFETIVITRPASDGVPSWITDLDTYFTAGWDENNFGLFSTGTVNAVSLRQDDTVNVTHDGSIRFVTNAEAGELSLPADLTLAVRAGQFNATQYAGTIYVDPGVSVVAGNQGTPNTGTVSVFGNVLVDGQVLSLEDRSMELQGRGGDIIIDSDTSAAGRVLLSPGQGFDVIFTNAATFRVTQGASAEGDLVILSARNVVMDPGTAIVADGSVLIGADNITGRVVEATGFNRVEGDIILYNVRADANDSGTGDIVVYTSGARSGESYDFDYGNGLNSYQVTGSIFLGRQDVVDDLVANLALDPNFLDDPLNVPAPALQAQNVRLFAADSIQSGWAIDYGSGDLRPGQEPLHIVAQQSAVLDARGGVVGGTPFLGVGSALTPSEQPIRVDVGDLLAIGAGLHDRFGVSANLVGDAFRLVEIDRVPGLILFNTWAVGGALEEKFASGTSIDAASYFDASCGVMGGPEYSCTMAGRYPTANATYDANLVIGQPQPVTALWVRDGDGAAGEWNLILEPGELVNFRSYQVVTGDTLWDIAEQYLGDPLRWQEIWWLTEGIDNPDVIEPGQEVNLEFQDIKRLQELKAEEEAEAKARAEAEAGEATSF